MRRQPQPSPGRPHQRVRTAPSTPGAAPCGRRFRLSERLGSDGFSESFKAQQISEDGGERWVFLRVVKPLPDSAMRHLLEWAPRAMRVRHPHVLLPSDVVQLQDGWALVSEYTPGIDLARLQPALARERQRIPLAATGQLMAGVFAGLHGAAAALGRSGSPLGLVHGNLRPERVLITGRGEVKVRGFAFGVSRSATWLREGRAGATWDPPEVLSGAAAAPSGDLYVAMKMAAGCMLGGWLGASPRRARDHRAWRDGVVRELEQRLGPSASSRALVDLMHAGLCFVSSGRPSALDAAESFAQLAEEQPGQDLVPFAGTAIQMILDRAPRPEPAEGLLTEHVVTLDQLLPEEQTTDVPGQPVGTLELEPLGISMPAPRPARPLLWLAVSSLVATAVAASLVAAALFALP